MRNIIYVIFLSFIILHMKGYSQDLQELKQNIKKEETAHNWNALAQYYYETSDTTEFRISANKAYQLAIKEKNDTEIGIALMHIGEVIYNTSGYIGNIEKNKEALKHFIKVNNFDLQSQAYGNIAYAYNAIGKFDDAINYYQKVRTLILKHDKNSDQPGEILHNIGISYLNKGISDSAIFYIHHSEKIAEEKRDTMLLIESYNTLGVIHKKNEDYKQALKYYEKCLQLYEALNKQRESCFTWMNIASLYGDWKKYDKALEFGRKSIADALISNLEKDDKGRLLNNLGTILILNHKYQSGCDTLYLAKTFINDNNHQKYINTIALSSAYYYLNNEDSCEYYLDRSECLLSENKDFPAYRFLKYKGLLLVKKKLYTEAILYLEKYIKLFDNPKLKYSSDEYEVYNSLSTAYEIGHKDYKKALLYKNLAFEKRDALYKDDHNRALNDFYARYETAEKELKIVKLNEERQRILYNRTLLIGGLVITFILLLSVLIHTRYLKQKRLKDAQEFIKRIEQKDLQFETIKKENELQQVQQYLSGLETERDRIAKELHDNVTNELVSIDKSIQKKDLNIEAISLRIEQLHNLVRDISHKLISPSFQYASIDEVLHLYTHSLNENSNINFHLNISNNILNNDLSQKGSLEIYRIIQEATNNIIKHSSAKNVWINILENDSTFIISIEDDGIGFKIQEKTNGVGLRIIRDRVKNLNGELKLLSQPGKGTKIIININYSTTSDE